MNTSIYFFTKIRVYAFTIALISCIFVVNTLPAYAVAPFDVTVSNFAQLQTAVEKTYATATDDMVITVSAPISISAILTVPSPATGGKTLTIKSASSSKIVTLTRGVAGNLFTVALGASLILQDIVIDGAKNGSFSTDGGGPLVRIVGACMLQSGAVLQNNVFAGEFGYGGGIRSDDGSSCIINGGKISGNTAGSKGGGVFTGLGTFILNSGEISGNTCVSGQGGGVHTYDSHFVLNGGEISGNRCISGQGGGVFSISPSVSSPVTINGGKISGNSATTGGGVYITETQFVQNSGEITGNSATADGGGVYIHISAFSFIGGKITGNSAANNGGGVLVYSEMFSMSGGEITGNSAASNGGGVYIPAGSYDADFFLGGAAKINGNLKGTGTGGSANNVYLGNDRYITLGVRESGMSVGVQTATAGGVISQAGANDSDVNYFKADNNSKVVHEGGQLKISAQ